MLLAPSGDPTLAGPPRQPAGLEAEAIGRAGAAPGPRLLLVGAAGAGMRALRSVLAQRGCHVVAYDDAAPFDQPAIATHAAALRCAGFDQLIHSPAVAPTHPLLATARSHDVPVVSYPRQLARLMATHRGIAIAGTHGKSTTTAMLGAILHAAGCDPTVIGGARPVGSSSGGRAGQGPWLVAEACEYREHFLQLCPEVAVVLSIEPDHFDHYASHERLLASFRRFVALAPRDCGLVVAHAACPATQAVLAAAEARCVRFAIEPHSSGPLDWQARRLRQQRGRFTFDICCRRRLLGTVALQMLGRHQVTNALAAAAVAGELGVSASAIVDALGAFRGVERRLETVVDGPVALLDDYAHHPTEVRAALAAARLAYPGRRLIAVFQPHQISRTARLLDEYAASLHNADCVIVADVCAARETNTDQARRLADTLVRRVAQAGARMWPDHETPSILRRLERELAVGDVVLLLGAGDLRKLRDGIVHRIQDDRAPARTTGTVDVVPPGRSG